MLATSGPYSDVYALLDNMKANLVAESAAQAAVYKNQMEDCGEEKTLRQGEMDEATKSNNAAQAQFNTCTQAADVADAALTLN